MPLLSIALVKLFNSAELRLDSCTVEVLCVATNPPVCVYVTTSSFACFFVPADSAFLADASTAQNASSESAVVQSAAREELEKITLMFPNRGRTSMVTVNVQIFLPAILYASELAECEQRSNEPTLQHWQAPHAIQAIEQLSCRALSSPAQ